MADSSVRVYETKDTVIGQPQSRGREPHDGATLLHEIVVHTDRAILDPNDEIAVQVPEGVGASTVGASPALSALKEGTAEEQFARSQESPAQEETRSKSSRKQEAKVPPEETGEQK